MAQGPCVENPGGQFGCHFLVVLLMMSLGDRVQDAERYDWVFQHIRSPRQAKRQREAFRKERRQQRLASRPFRNARGQDFKDEAVFKEFRSIVGGEILHFLKDAPVYFRILFFFAKKNKNVITLN